MFRKLRGADTASSGTTSACPIGVFRASELSQAVASATAGISLWGDGGTDADEDEDEDGVKGSLGHAVPAGSQRLAGGIAGMSLSGDGRTLAVASTAGPCFAFPARMLDGMPGGAAGALRV